MISADEIRCYIPRLECEQTAASLASRTEPRHGYARAGKRRETPTDAGLSAVSDTGRTLTRLRIDILGLFPLLRPPLENEIDVDRSLEIARVDVPVRTGGKSAQDVG
jgi:hypothetical protein